MKKNEKQTILTAFIEHKRILSSYLAGHLLRPDDVDDILQETFIQAYGQEKKQKTKILSPKSYLFIIARNLLSKQFSQQRRAMIQELDESSFSNLENNETPIDDQVHQRQKMKVFLKAADSLPPQCRKVFLLRKLYGYSHKKIAEQMGISTSTIERHITIALSRVNILMQQEGYQQDRSDIHEIKHNAPLKKGGRHE